MTPKNADVKAGAMRNDVRLYQIAQYLGISESTLNKKLRSMLSEDDRKRFLNAIEEIAKSKQ